MKESALTSSNRLGGAVISDRIVASLLEELRTGRYARADRLPAGITLTDLQVDGDEAVIDIDVDGRIATDEKLLENGSC